jgi:hypothetical protein
MRKILAGVFVVAVIAAIGLYVGLPYYAQMRAERAVAAAFETARSNGGEGTYGPVTFTLSDRQLTIADVRLKPKGDQVLAVTIGRVVATRVDQPDPGRVTAGRIELSDIAITGPGTVPASMDVSFKIPKLVIENYAGPVQLPPALPPDITAPARQAFLLLAATSAQSVTAPTVTMRGSAASNPPLPRFDVEYTYSDLALRDIREGRIASVLVDRVAFASTMPDGGKLTGEGGKLSMREVDLNPLIAVLDPSGSTIDRYMPIYKQIESGPITMKMDSVAEVRLGGMSLDEVALHPAKLKLPDLLTIRDLMPPPGQQPSPEQTRMILEKVASVYEGMRLGRLEMRDMSMSLAVQQPFTLAAIRISNLENGKFGEIAMEGFDGRTASNEPFHLGRVAIRGFDIVKFMRVASQLTPGRQPSSDQIASLFGGIEGIALNDIDIDSKATGRPAKIVAYDMSWGQFIGPLPSRLTFMAKLVTPIRPDEREPYFSDLAKAGVKELTSDINLTLSWNESTQTFTLAPLDLNVGNTAGFSAKARLNNVSRAMFTTEPASLMAAAVAVDVGPIELSLRDTGGVDMALREFGRMQGVSSDGARTMLAALITAQAAAFTQDNPDLQILADRLVEFLNNRGATLTISIEPKARVNLMQSIALAKADPIALLPQFKLDIKVGK